MLEVTELTKKYGGKTAVDRLSFSVQKGEILGFLGPNGAGKSTAMNMITGYLSPTFGSVRIAGIDMSEEPEEAKRHIGYLPEIPPLYTDMTVEEYLRFAARLKKVPGGKAAQQAQIDRVCERTFLKDVRKRLIGHLSKGYRQRTGIAQALISDPDILIFDEPSVGLDPRQVMEMRLLIKSLQKDHLVILSSHILAEIQAVCTRVLILQDGRLAADHVQEGENSPDRYSLLVEGQRKRVEELLLALPHVREIGFQGNEGPDIGRYLLECAKDQPVRRNIYDAIAAGGGMRLLGLEKTRASLEELFISATAGGRLREEGRA